MLGSHRLRISNGVHGNQQPVTWVGDKQTVVQPSSCVSCDPASCCDESVGAGLLQSTGLRRLSARGHRRLRGIGFVQGRQRRQLPEQFWRVTGLNAAMPVPGLRDYGIGWQLGMSYGVYDFDGWGRRHHHRVSPAANLRDHRLLSQGPMRSAAELWLGLRLDVQQQLGRISA